jgi:hypothetical protein
MIYEQIFADLCHPIFSTQLPRSDLVIQKLSAKAIIALRASVKFGHYKLSMAKCFCSRQATITGTDDHID